MKSHSILSLTVAWLITCVYWFVPESQRGFAFIITMTVVTASWLCYAIGTSGVVLNNKIVKYLSGISMEINLCHMMSFRAVQFLHIDSYVDNTYLVYWIVGILTLAVAVAFSHVVKFYILPFVMKLIPSGSHDGLGKCL